MQILDGDQTAGFSHLGRQFVEQVSAQASNAIMQATELAPGLLPVLSAFGASSQFFVQAAQLLQEMAQRSLVLVPPPI